MADEQSLAESTPAQASQNDAQSANSSFAEAFTASLVQAVAAGAAPPPFPESANQAPAPQAAPAAPPTETPAAPSDAPAPVQAAPDQTPPAAGQRPSQHVPYDRFQEVNTERTRLEAELATERANASALQTAVKAGFSTVAEYQQANAYAKANNFDSIETMQDAFKQAQAVQQYDAQLQQRVFEGQISEELRQELLQGRQQQIATQAMLANIQRQQKFTETQLQEQAISSAHAQFQALGVPMDEAFEATLRTMNPVDIARTTQVQVNWAKKIIQNSTGEYAATKLAAQQVVTPMGSGGAPPPPAQPQQRSFTDSDMANMDFLDAFKISQPDIVKRMERGW